MKEFFECVVTYDKVNEEGLAKKTSESNLFEAVNHGDAEQRCVEELADSIGGEYMVTKVMRRKYADIFDDSEKNFFYNAKVGIITLDEKSGKEKATTLSILVRADNISEVLATIKEKYTMCDYEVQAVSKSSILEVFRVNE